MKPKATTEKNTPSSKRPRTTTRRSEDVPVKQRLLDEAKRLFAEKGFDGVTVDEVVQAAGVNKNMVYYYFGNKEKLYLAVFNAAYAELEKFELSLIHEDLSPDVLVEKLVKLYFELHHDHEELTRIVLWENLGRGRHLGGPKLKGARGRAYMVVRSVLEKGKMEGLVRMDIDDKLFMVSLIGMCQIFASNRYTLSRGLDLDLNSPEVLKLGQKQVVRVLLKGIKP